MFPDALPRQRPPIITLNLPAYRWACTEGSVTSDTQAARLFGVSRSTILRARQGGRCGDDLVAGVLKAFPRLSFEELFNLTERDPNREVTPRCATASTPST